jgi:hypothetical protein
MIIGDERLKENWIQVQLGVNKPSVINCTAQLLKVLGVDGLTEGSFMPPSTSIFTDQTLSIGN